jgi:hypothetical protein
MLQSNDARTHYGLKIPARETEWLHDGIRILPAVVQTAESLFPFIS